jgi:chemotaxis protein CheD
LILKDVYLKPGEWFCGGANTKVRTTLGSCVAFTFWHQEQALGGMFHYMLPDRARLKNTNQPLDGRYADEALSLMNTAVTRQGGRLQDCQVKIFGGAAMFAAVDQRKLVSTRNVAAAWHLAEEYRLKVSAHDLGGNAYRQLIFDINTGDVFMKKGVAAPDFQYPEIG